MPADLLGGLDKTGAARTFIIEEDCEIGEKFWLPPLPIKSLTRSGK